MCNDCTTRTCVSCVLVYYNHVCTCSTVAGVNSRGMSEVVSEALAPSVIKLSTSTDAGGLIHGTHRGGTR